MEAISLVSALGKAMTHGMIDRWSSYLRASMFLVVFSPLAAVWASLGLEAPDSTLPGPYAVTEAEYRFEAGVDPDVLADVPTEVWAAVYRPASLGGKPRPLILFLHGNHATCGQGANPRQDDGCEYTDTGTCPDGSVVVPNHLGYAYLAKNLASWGYVVASINANRGITCGSGNDDDFGLNLARGRLVLKHLRMWSEWSRSGGAPASLGVGNAGFVGRIDMGSVGLMGHSRGGEGVRAALNLFNDAGSAWPRVIPRLQIKAIFEIGAVDGQTSRVLDADGVAWNQLLPMCDGDVSGLEGRYPYERMLMKKGERPEAQKSLQMVWGANHNFFNTEWQESDSDSCYELTAIFPAAPGSVEQQRVALASLPAFFRGQLGTPQEASFNQVFNPLIPLPKVLSATTRVERDFSVSPSFEESHSLEEFDRAKGISSAGLPHVLRNLTTMHLSLPGGGRAAKLEWKSSPKGASFETAWAAGRLGRDFGEYRVLEFRVGRTTNMGASAPPTVFSVELIDASGNASKAVRTSDFAEIVGPAHQFAHTLQTIRIPLAAFSGVDLGQVSSLRLSFDPDTEGSLHLANVRLARSFGRGALDAPWAPGRLESARRVPAPRRYPGIARRARPPVRHGFAKNRVVGLRRVSGPGESRREPVVEIELESDAKFPVRDDLIVLKVGRRKVLRSRYVSGSGLRRMIFTVREKEFRAMGQGESMSVEYDSGARETWSFGGLDKRALK